VSAALIIWNKQMGKFARNGQESIGSLIQPVLWVVMFGVGMRSLLEPSLGNGDTYVSFMLPGIIALTVLSGATGGGMTWLLERVQGIVKEYIVAPIARISILLGNAASIMTKALIQSVVILVVGVLVGATVSGGVLDWVASLALVLLFGIGFSGIALAAGSSTDDIGVYHMMIALLQLPMLFMSNALYPLDSLPTWLAWVARFNPASYLVDGLRQTILTDALTMAGSELLPLWACFAVCTGFAVAGMVLSLRVFRSSLG
jgi:ABC-2 type transport system permease protein